MLAGGSRPVSEVAAEFAVTRSAISQHLGVLSDAGLVDAEKVGRQRVYRVLPEGLRRLQAEIDRFWTDELDRLAYVTTLSEPVIAVGRGSSFAGETTVADDAPPADRLAAFAGRTPMAAASKQGV